MRSYFVFFLLLAIKYASRALFRLRLQWCGTVPADPWADLRVLAVLNHTSLFEPILAGLLPNRVVWQIAAHGVVPVADKTASRPLVGYFFRFVAHRVIPITRERDETWTIVLEGVEDPRALVVILPEGRMKRRTGLDLHGKPMTLRGGVADILRAVPEGRMLVAYSPGLHHVHAPGDSFPRLFKRVRLTAEVLDIASYRESLLARAGEEGFKRAVIQDLTRRRDERCQDDPPGEGAPRDGGAGEDAA